MLSIYKKATLRSTTAIVLGAALAMTSMTASNPAQAQTSEVQAPDPTTFNEDAISVTSLVSDVMAEAAQRTRQHTIPGGVVAMDNLRLSMLRSESSDSAKAQALLRLSEMHLRLLGDANSAALINAAARIVESDSPRTATAYMRGVAQDLRQAGSVAAAQYLENNANLVIEGLYSPRIGIMDAAAISLNFGVTPQPGLAAMLGANLEEIDTDYLQNAASDLLTHLGSVTGDEGYEGLAQKASNISQDDVETIRAIIIQAKQERQQRFEESIRQRPAANTIQERPNADVFR